jgi:hypothetical protein
MIPTMEELSAGVQKIFADASRYSPTPRTVSSGTSKERERESETYIIYIYIYDIYASGLRPIFSLHWK